MCKKIADSIKVLELKKYSNPNIVLKKAKKYLGKNVQIEISGRKDKRYGKKSNK